MHEVRMGVAIIRPQALSGELELPDQQRMLSQAKLYCYKD
jgi:hypothetical protein